MREIGRTGLDIGSFFDSQKSAIDLLKLFKMKNVIYRSIKASFDVQYTENFLSVI